VSLRLYNIKVQWPWIQNYLGPLCSTGMTTEGTDKYHRIERQASRTKFRHMRTAVRINIMAKVYGSHNRTLGSTCWKLLVHWRTILEFSKGKSFHPLKVKLLKMTHENMLINHTEVSAIS